MSARTYKDTGIKLGGWTVHAHMDSVTPESVVFDEKVYAILWKGRSKKPTAKPGETTEPAKPDETTQPAKPDETKQPAKPGETIQPAKPDETTTRPEENDVEMQLVLSKNQRKKLKKKTNGKLEQPRKSNRQKNKDITNEQSTTRSKHSHVAESLYLCYTHPLRTAMSIPDYIINMH